MTIVFRSGLECECEFELVGLKPDERIGSWPEHVSLAAF